MASTDKVFAGAIPQMYDRFMVPLIFEDYAQDLAGRVAGLHPHDILEIAAGTGVVTRALAGRLGPAARIVASDLNQAMLDHAARRQGDDARLVWRQADAMALPFPDRAFDVALCQFGAMFFPDRSRAYGEVRRVLKPGGQYLFNVWDRLAANEFAATVTNALAEVFPHDPPAFMARTPHGYHDAELIRRDLTAAGFRSIAIETLERRSRAGSARDAAIAYCQGTPLRTEIEARGAPGLEEATRRAEEALAQRFGAGPIDGGISALVVTAIP